MMDPIPQGSTECPICGSGEPHPHTPRDIEAWLQAQASRFGYHLRAFPHKETADLFLYEAIKNLEAAQDDLCSSLGYQADGYRDAIDGLKEYAARRTPAAVEPAQGSQVTNLLAAGQALYDAIGDVRADERPLQNDGMLKAGVAWCKASEAAIASQTAPRNPAGRE